MLPFQARSESQASIGKEKSKNPIVYIEDFETTKKNAPLRYI